MQRDTAFLSMTQKVRYEDKTVHIDFNYRDEIASYQEIIKNISQEVS